MAVGFFVWSWPGLIVLDGDWTVWHMGMAPVAVGALVVLVLGGLTMFGAVYWLDWTLARRASVWVLSAMALLPFVAQPIFLGIFLGPIIGIQMLLGWDSMESGLVKLLILLAVLYPLIFAHAFYLVVSDLPRRAKQVG